MSKHTPGPWELFEDADLCEIRMGSALENNGTYSTQHCIEMPCVEYDSEEPDDSPGNRQADEAWANARLVASAPDLLEACEAAFGVLCDMGLDHMVAFDVVEKAIAKAKGEAS